MMQHNIARNPYEILPTVSSKSNKLIVAIETSEPFKRFVYVKTQRQRKYAHFEREKA